VVDLDVLGVWSLGLYLASSISYHVSQSIQGGPKSKPLSVIIIISY